MLVIYKNYYFNFLTVLRPALPSEPLNGSAKVVVSDINSNIYHLPFTTDLKFLDIQQPLMISIAMDKSIVSLIFAKLSIQKQKLFNLIFKEYPIKSLDLSSFPNVTQEDITKKYVNGEYCWKDLISLNIKNTKINNINHLSLKKLICNDIIDQEGIEKLSDLKILHVDVYHSIGVDNTAHTGVNTSKGVNDVSFCKDTLEELSAQYNSGINQEGIEKLNKLRILYCDGNPRINNVNHLNNSLQLLSAQLNNNIDQAGISKLNNLKILRISYNEKIFNLKKLQNSLLELSIEGSYGEINQKDIQGFKNLEILNINYNDKINNVNHLKNLRKLYARGISGLDQNGLSLLENLEVLSCGDNTQINNVNHLKNTLRELYIQGSCAVNQEGISLLNKVEILNCDDNPNVNNVNHLKDTLIELHANGLSAINQEGIKKLQKLRILYCNSNSNIKNVNFLNDTLEELHARKTSGINKIGIQKLTHLKVLDIEDNKKV
jgi:hypothetical protein